MKSIRDQINAAMDSLAWLTQHRLQSVLRRDYDWMFLFDNGASLVVSCLWRLIEDGRIRLTSADEGQQFDLPAPVDVTAELNRRVVNAAVEGVVLLAKTLDLELRCDTGHVLQVIPDSAGYEAWIANDRDQQFIAVGGGELVVFGGQAATGDQPA